MKYNILVTTGLALTIGLGYSHTAFAAEHSVAEESRETQIQYGGDSIPVPPNSRAFVTYKTDNGTILTTFTFENKSGREQSWITPKGSYTNSDGATVITIEVRVEPL